MRDKALHGALIEFSAFSNRSHKWGDDSTSFVLFGLAASEWVLTAGEGDVVEMKLCLKKEGVKRSR